MPSVFPYPADKAIPMNYFREEYQSQPYSGNPKTLSRGVFRRAWQLSFANRTQAEIDAAMAFIVANPKPISITFRNYRYYPARDYTCWIVPGSFREQGSQVSFRFTYFFDVEEIY